MKKYDLSVLIPSRNEMFLAKTVEDLLKHKEGNTEIIVGLDGAWADPQIPDHPDVRLVYYPNSIGQRAMTNQLCKLSSAKYVLKCDAHTAWDQGFDVKMMAIMQDNWTMVPVMRNLHAFNWVCPAGHARYQGPSGPCQTAGCGKPTTRDVVWIPKTSPQSKSYCFDPEPHFQYFGAFNKRPEGKPDDLGLTETMSLQGSCFMLTREKYWELEMGNETWGSWGSQGIQVAASTWLSGGRVVVNHRTWYAHLFRTQGGDFSFPYPQSGRQVQDTKKYAKNILHQNKFPKQILPAHWLVERFWPVDHWTEKDLLELKKSCSSFVDLIAKELRILGIIPVVPSPVADHASPVPPNGSGKEVSIPTMSLPSLDGSDTLPSKNILGIGNKSEVSRITAGTIITDMVKNWYVSTLAGRDTGNKPGVYETVGKVKFLVNPDLSVSRLEGSNPVPATANGVDSNLSKDATNGLRGDIVHDKHIGDVHDTSIAQSKSPSKSIIFYTDNRLNLKIAHKVQKQLSKISKDKNIPIISASLKPMSFGDKNIHIPMERGYLAYFTQIIAALEASTADIIYFCEHDCLYAPEHFDFTPLNKETFYYDHSWWKIGMGDLAVHWDADQVSGLCCYREVALAWYKKKLETFERDKFDRKFEPMSGEKSESWKASVPMIDIRHDGALTKNKWSLADFRDKTTAKNFQGSTIDKIPGWNAQELRDILKK